MQIVPVATSSPSLRPSGGDARAVEPVTELLRGTPSRPSPERVLQGEFLERGRDPESGRSERERIFAQRREDHPGFYARRDNAAYLQRRAIAAYHAHSAAGEPRRGGRSLDYFV